MQSQELRSECDDLRTKLALSTEEAGEAAIEQKNLEEKVQELQASLQTSLQASEGKAEEIHRESERWEQELQQERQAAEELKEQLVAVENSQREAADELQQGKASQQGLDAEMQELLEESKLRQESLANSNSTELAAYRASEMQSQELRSECDDLRTKLALSTEEAGEAAVEQKNLEEKVQELRASLQTSLQASEDKAEEIHRESERWEQELQQERQAAEELKEQLAAVENSQREAADELQQGKASQRGLDAEMQELLEESKLRQESLANSSSTELAAYRASEMQSQELRSECDDLRTKLALSTEEACKAAVEQKNLEEKVQELQASLQTSLQASEDKAEEIHRESERWEQELQQERQAAEELKEQLAAVEDSQREAADELQQGKASQRGLDAEMQELLEESKLRQESLANSSSTELAAYRASEMQSQELRSECDDLRTKLALSTEEAGEAAIEQKNLEEKVQELQASLQTSLQASEDKAEEIHRESERWEQELQQERQAAEELKEQLAAVEDSQREAADELQQGKASQQGLESDRKVLGEKCSELQSLLESAEQAKQRSGGESEAKEQHQAQEFEELLTTFNQTLAERSACQSLADKWEASSEVLSQQLEHLQSHGQLVCSEGEERVSQLHSELQARSFEESEALAQVELFRRECQQLQERQAEAGLEVFGELEEQKRLLEKEKQDAKQWRTIIIEEQDRSRALQEQLSDALRERLEAKRQEATQRRDVERLQRECEALSVRSRFDDESPEEIKVSLGRDEESSFVQNLPSPCRTRRPLGFSTNLGDEPCEPWLDSPSKSQSPVRGRQPAAAVDLRRIVDERRVEVQQLQEQLEEERHRHTLLEDDWRQHGEELLALVHSADLELVKRDAVLGERESRNSELSRRLSEQLEDLEFDKQDLSARKLLIAEKELKLQDREAALVKLELEADQRLLAAATANHDTAQNNAFFASPLAARSCGAGAAVLLAFQAVWRVAALYELASRHRLQSSAIPADAASEALPITRPLLQTVAAHPALGCPGPWAGSLAFWHSTLSSGKTGPPVGRGRNEGSWCRLQLARWAPPRQQELWNRLIWHLLDRAAMADVDFACASGVCDLVLRLGLSLVHRVTSTVTTPIVTVGTTSVTEQSASSQVMQGSLTFQLDGATSVQVQTAMSAFLMQILNVSASSLTVTARQLESRRLVEARRLTARWNVPFQAMVSQEQLPAVVSAAGALSGSSSKGRKQCTGAPVPSVGDPQGGSPCSQSESSRKVRDLSKVYCRVLASLLVPREGLWCPLCPEKVYCRVAAPPFVPREGRFARSVICACCPLCPVWEYCRVAALLLVPREGRLARSVCLVFCPLRPVWEYCRVAALLLMPREGVWCPLCPEKVYCRVATPPFVPRVGRLARSVI
ncbi:unnamed protein product [Polarella glacialis]|uniref:Uncharacterized protein n=1 Tax=Polarella glacialis TaxID=89957 RepID=A0A813DQ25_POLGL|nr:unnamed protein product [Polarella glacialis]